MGASSRHSAIRDVTSYLFRGRVIAVQQSRAAWVVRSGNILKILVDSSGTPVQLGTQLDFSTRYGATLSARPKDTVTFDQRGLPGSEREPVGAHDPRGRRLEHVLQLW